ncbi:hypothetical protein [Ralstonia pseudosolanacearum]|uniref:hypothetical protein n=1 Tax=Ralstonia pseudosolanacearum TaxID=1310165 RepID=UPI00222FC290|nr:hypothetical protein [Ralstonia sp. RS650]UZF31845.1 hypothetical protein LGV82_13165 [Ralstonia sp. RS650]
MLSQTVQNYIDMRRSSGFQFVCQAVFLHSFASFAAAKKEHHVRANTAIEWAGRAAKVPQRAHRLWVVIRFARYAQTDDSRHEIPSPVFGSETWPRRTPYILSQDEIARLMQAASCFGTHPRQGATYSTLFGLLACTGLRISEALRLRHQDITPDGLLIRNQVSQEPIGGLARQCSRCPEALPVAMAVDHATGRSCVRVLAGHTPDQGVRGRCVS